MSSSVLDQDKVFELLKNNYVKFVFQDIESYLRT